jgi:hypothetical protein
VFCAPGMADVASQGAPGGHGRGTAGIPTRPTDSPLGEALARVLPGDPYSRPWEDLPNWAMRSRPSGFSSPPTSSA